MSTGKGLSMLRWSVLALTPLLAWSAVPVVQAQAPASAIPDLDGLLAFRSAAQCIPGPALTTLLDDLAVFDEKTVVPRAGKVTVPPAYRSATGSLKQIRSQHGLTLRVPMRGLWRGVPVVAIEGHYWNGGDPGGFSIIMRSPRQAVLTMLNRQGFRLPPNGVRELPSDGYDTTISLESKGTEATFSCM
jgi:hypothetical protein